MEAYLAEKLNVAIASAPYDGNTVASGLLINMKGYKRCTFIVNYGDGSSGTVTPSFLQADAASAGTSKPLSHANPYYVKVDDAAAFTKVEPVAAAASFDLSTLLANDPGLAIFEVLAEDLDVENDFAWVSLDHADVTSTKLISVVALLDGGPKPAYAVEL